MNADAGFVAILTADRPGVEARLAELDVLAAEHPLNQEWSAKAAEYRACLAEIDQHLAANPVCDQFAPAEGGAHPWCDTCGWQAQQHPTEGDDMPTDTSAAARGVRQGSGG